MHRSETGGHRLDPCGLQIRAYGSCLAVSHRILLPVMVWQRQPRPRARRLCAFVQGVLKMAEMTHLREFLSRSGVEYDSLRRRQRWGTLLIERQSLQEAHKGKGGQSPILRSVNSTPFLFTSPAIRAGLATLSWGHQRA
jgi:hypothetical protein